MTRDTVTTIHRLRRLLVALLLACCLLILAGLRISPAFRRRVCSRGQLGILHLGYECFLATPDPPPQLFTPLSHQTRVRVRDAEWLTVSKQSVNLIETVC